MILPAISVRNPWAWAIIHAGKNIENRTWQANVRGPLLIHAASRMNIGDFGKVRQILAETTSMDAALVSSDNPDLQTGGVIGIVEVVGCWHWLNENVPRNPWMNGPFCIVMKNQRPLPFLKCKGQTGIFRIDYPDDTGIFRIDYPDDLFTRFDY